MYRLYPALLEAAVAAVFLIPFLLFCRRQHTENTTVTLLTILFAMYLSAVYAVVGLPSVIYLRYAPRFNFKPFLYMFSDHTTSLLNVMLFIPLGFLLPILWGRFRKIGWTFLGGFLLSAFIELLQIFTYRATDINDLITNSAGTLIGFLFGSIFYRKFPAISTGETSISPIVIFSAVFCTMFFMQPLLMWILFHSF